MIADEAIPVNGYAVTIASGQNVVLDLNGKTVTGVCDSASTSALIRNLGTLTVNDSGSNGKLIGGADPTWTWDGSDDYTGSYASNLIRNEGTLTVNGGTLYNASSGSAAYAIDNYGAGKVTVNGGTIDARKASAIRLFYNNGGGITVTGGTIGRYISDDDCCYMGIQVMAGTNADVTVTGGTISGYYALYSNGSGDSSVDISGGLLDGIVGFGSAGPDTVSISGGKYTAEIAAWGTQTGFISGGLFAEKPDAALCAEGLYPIDNQDEATKDEYPYTVGGAVAEVNEDYFATFDEAAAARTSDDDIVTLLANIEAAYTLESGSLKVKLADKTLTVNAPDGKVLLTSGPDDDGITTYTIAEPVAKIDEALYATLQAAIDAAYEMTGSVTVTLIADITEVAIIHQKAGLDLTVDGDGKTITGQIYIDGDGRYEGTDTLTIKNTKFAYDAATYDDAFIDVPSTKTAGKPYSTGKYNYAHNIKVTNCEFAGEGGTTVAFRVASGAGANKVELDSLTVTGGHSMAQLFGVKDLTISNSTVTGTKNGINISGGEGTGTITGNTLTTNGYTVRVKEASGMDVTLTDNTFSGVEGIISTATSGGKITVADGKYAGPLPTDADKFTVEGGLFTEKPDAAVCAEGLYPVDNQDEATKAEYPYTVGAAVASVTKEGTTTYYMTLVEAVEKAETGATVTLLKDASGAGIFVGANDGKNITIDLGGNTYTVIGPAVGSSGTQSQAFHLEKDNTIKITNGKVTSTADSGVLMLVQNYCALTLTGVELDGTNLPGSGRYVLSNNNGSAVIDGSKITAKDGDFAFDVCRYASYPSVNVTVTGDSEINGKIEVSASGSDAKDGFGLTLESGTFNGELVLDATAKAAMASTPEKVNIIKSNDVDEAAPDGYAWHDLGNGTSKLAAAVAKIGDTLYASLLDAVSAVPADGTETTITMINDDAVVAGVTIAAGQNIILELNGKAITGNTDSS